MSTPSPEGAAGRRVRTFSLAGLAILFLLPLFLRLAPIQHGMPRNYVPDTHMVRQALGMARDKDPFPPVDTYSTYPNLVPYMLLPVYGGYFAVGMATGAWSGTEEFGDAVIADPSGVQLLARVLVALFGALTPFVVFRTARLAGLTRGAWIAAWVVATGVLHTQFSVQERPWVPMVFFLALSGWPAAAYVREARFKWLLLSGVAAGLSLACHQSGLLSLAVPGLAWLFSPLSMRGADVKKRVLHGAACVSVFGLVALVLGFPHILLYGATPVADTIGGAAGDISLGGQSHTIGFRLASLVHMTKAFIGYDPVLVLLALLGLPLALRVRAARPVTIYAILWAAYFMPHENDHVRYLLPIGVMLGVSAGFAGEWLMARGRRAAVGLLVLLALALAQDLRLGWVLGQEDTRALAERELSAALPPGARLAVDRYGPILDLDAGALAELIEIRRMQGAELSTREAHRAARAHRQDLGGVDALYLHELFDFDERQGTITIRDAFRDDPLPDAGDPPERLRELLLSRGVTHLLLVDRDPLDPSGCLMRPVTAGREPLLVIDPSAEPDGFDEARLPTDMDFPLSALWQVERPGPWMALYDLR